MKKYKKETIIVEADDNVRYFIKYFAYIETATDGLYTPSGFDVTFPLTKDELHIMKKDGTMDYARYKFKKDIEEYDKKFLKDIDMIMTRPANLNLKLLSGKSPYIKRDQISEHRIIINRNDREEYI
jgi:hypothetical protein